MQPNLAFLRIRCADGSYTRILKRDGKVVLQRKEPVYSPNFFIDDIFAPTTQTTQQVITEMQQAMAAGYMNKAMADIAEIMRKAGEA